MSLRRFSQALSVLVAAGLGLFLIGFGITEEVPIGSLEGRVVMTENEKPLPKAYVTISTDIEDSPTGVHELRSVGRYAGTPDEEPGYLHRTVRTDENGAFRFLNLPQGRYRVYVSGTAHSADRMVQVIEGPATKLDVAADPHEPYLNLYTSQRVYTPNETPKIEAHGFSFDAKMRVRTYRLDLDTIAAKGGLQDLLGSFSRYSFKPVNPSTLAERTEDRELEITQRDVEGVFIERLELPAQREGFYYVEVESGNVRRGTFLNVSRIAMVTKSAPGQAVCYVTDLESGRPLAEASIQKLQGTRLETVGRTAIDGTLEMGGTVEGSNMLVASHGGSIALTQFYQYGEPRGASTRLFVYTDRPVYRPGDEISFKGIARRLTGNTYTLAGTGTAEVEVVDASGTTVQTLELPIGEQGSFSGSFRTNREAAPGLYSLVCKAFGQVEEHYVSVAAYRKPEYSVTITPERPFYEMGAKARFVLKAEYYFGGPVVGATVRASVFRNAIYAYLDEEGEDAEYDDSYGGEYLEELEAVTNERGEAVLEFATRRKGDAVSLETDYRYQINASVADAGGKYYDGQGSVKVTRGEFALTVDPGVYVVQPESTLTAVITAQGHDGSPVAGKRVRLEVATESWLNGIRDLKVLQSFDLTTNAQGEANTPMSVPGRESLILRVSASDARGNTIVSESSVYVYGAAASGPAQSKLSLRLDRKSYRAGETCTAVIETSTPGAYALLTIEADRVLYKDVVPLNEALTYVRIPVNVEYAPNVTVSLAMIRAKEFSEVSRRMALDLGARRIQVSVEAEREQYLPGETATYTIRTKTEDGRPVPAEVSLGVVDESIYAIQPDRTDIVEGFYPRRYNQVQTRHSFPELYLDGGEKGDGQIRVRRDFKDTAAWMPSLRTDAGGELRVEVPLPDNLTSWRATVVGVTDDTRVGMARASVKVNQPLTVRLQLPRFLVQGDKVTIRALVSNNQETEAQAQVSLEVEGVGLAQGAATRRVSLKPGGMQSLEWTLDTPQAGRAKFVAKTWVDGGPSDGVEQTIAVAPHGRSVVETRTGEVETAGSFKFTVQPGAAPGFGGLCVSLSPSLAGGLIQSLEGLIDFPYGCTEQTMSRFLPATLVSQALGENSFALANPELRAKLPEIVQEGLARLLKMQHGDGGWGWWEMDDSDPFLTAYVLEGLWHAREAGLFPNSFMVSSGLEWGKARLASEEFRAKDSVADRLYLAYALTRHEAARPDAIRVLEATSFQKASSYELALGVLLADALGDPYQTKTAALRKALVARVEVGENVASWPRDEKGWGVESDARALSALVATQPDDPLIPKVIRYLLQQRKGRMWLSTRDTSYALIAMTTYLRFHPEGVEASEVSLTLNGQPLKTLSVAPGQFESPEFTLDIPLEALKEGENVLEIVRRGAGRLYVASEMRQVVVEPSIAAMSTIQGLTLDRKYYRLEPRRLEDGTMRLMPSPKPVDRIRAGDILRCVLTINSTIPREYVMVEDPLPSHCEAMTLGDVDYWEWWYSSLQVRDDRVAFFARFLPKGVSTLSYELRAEALGSARALPATVSNMYDPGEFFSTGETSLEVRP